MKIKIINSILIALTIICIAFYIYLITRTQEFDIISIPATELGEGTSPGTMIFVEGGELIHGISTPSFYIGKNLVTQIEYIEVMGSNPSIFQKDGIPAHPFLPVDNVPVSKAIAYCNRLSILSGLEPCFSYADEDGDYGTDPSQWPEGWYASDYNFQYIFFHPVANGFRLPNRVEWEFAARGGIPAQKQNTFNHRYAGTDDDDLVTDYAWYNKNAGRRNQLVGTKLPNELGIYDMSGNEWETTFSEERRRIIETRGGDTFFGIEYCRVTTKFIAHFAGHDKHGVGAGIRLVRNFDN